MRHGLTVFNDADAYLDPRNLPPVPLVKLPTKLVPFSFNDRVHIYAQLGYRWPLGNLKHPAVFEMLMTAHKNGLLGGVDTVSDSSSGNTAYTTAKLVSLVNIPRVRFFVPGDIPKIKEERLRDIGVSPIKCYDGPGEPSAIEQARAAGNERGCFYLNQYSNPANSLGHEKYHVKPAWEQLHERMTIYCAGLGTTGTIGGALSFSRKIAPIQVVAALCEDDNPVPGLRTRERLKEVPLAQSLFDAPPANLHIHRVSRYTAYKKSWALTQAKINGGPSSGSALAALEMFLETQRQKPEAWERLRNKDGNIVAVFMCGDSSELYPEKYSTILDPKDLIPNDHWVRVGEHQI